MSSLTSSLYTFGEFRVDTQSRSLFKGEVPIAITPKAFDVLLLLIQHSGELVSKDTLMQTVWPNSFVEESNLTQTVFMLRKALGETSSQRYILTVQGQGYRFVPDVKTLPVVEHPAATPVAPTPPIADRQAGAAIQNTSGSRIRVLCFAGCRLHTLAGSFVLASSNCITSAALHRRVAAR
jgi:DNA-binding winged helix-turn-helix (wHTH) protein